jgi:hypothetical protein
MRLFHQSTIRPKAGAGLCTKVPQKYFGAFRHHPLDSRLFGGRGCHNI